MTASTSGPTRLGIIRMLRRGRGTKARYARSLATVACEGLSEVWRAHAHQPERMCLVPRTDAETVCVRAGPDAIIAAAPQGSARRSCHLLERPRTSHWLLRRSRLPFRLGH